MSKDHKSGYAIMKERNEWLLKHAPCWLRYWYHLHFKLTDL